MTTLNGGDDQAVGERLALSPRKLHAAQTFVSVAVSNAATPGGSCS